MRGFNGHPLQPHPDAGSTLSDHQPPKDVGRQRQRLQKYDGCDAWCRMEWHFPRFYMQAHQSLDVCMPCSGCAKHNNRCRQSETGTLEM
eukprot:362818-Chlamydomonas_euryale.AAC.4